jgi:hypothetical protein
LVFLPSGGPVKVDLTASARASQVEWFDPVKAVTYTGNTVVGGAKRSLVAPFNGPAVLYLHSSNQAPSLD